MAGTSRALAIVRPGAQQQQDGGGGGAAGDASNPFKKPATGLALGGLMIPGVATCVDGSCWISARSLTATCNP